MYKKVLPLVLISLFFTGLSQAQEESPAVTYSAPSQNLLKFNRFLINPTFSTVREDKSYINLFHRNQSVSFDDNFQTYFLSYSGRIGDRSGVGLSLYTQREGIFNNFGVLANYAYGVKLSEKSNFTFGANFSYYNSGLDQGRANSLDPNDPLLGQDNSTLILFQPGFNLSFGRFDIGAFAENLFDYNLKTNESNTEFSEKTYSAHLQYTHQFENASGIFEQGRLLPLARVRKVGEDDISLGGGLIMDLPKLGWLQAGYDELFGASAGVGFNLNKRISLGYTMEKGLDNDLDNLGLTHEISLAYSFTPTLTEDRVMLEKEDDLVSIEEEETPIEELSLTEKDMKIAELEKKLAENDAILDELLFRQDSLEKNRQRDLERRFENVMRLVRRETQGKRPELEKQAKEMYLANMDSADIPKKALVEPLANHGLTNNTSAKKIIKLKDTKTPVSTTPAVAREVSKKDNIRYKKKSRNFKPFTIPNVQTGHYLIANVYRGTKYMNKFIDKLRAQGIEADYFQNPKNGLNYVYLKGYSNKQDAINAYRTKMNGQYQGDTWVMRVTGDYDNTQYANNDDKKSKYDDSALQQNVINENQGAPASPQNGVTYKTYNVDGLGSGFYIIANVFEKPSNANRFVKELNAKGLSASYFINPENNYRYVYLKKHNEWTNALISYYSKLNNQYHDQMWIMRVKPNHIS
ncbi:type IX secretion system membrane protein PorP/SprF [Allomuricauda sp. SCSIO 65647]|uniref:PorP/SprF family type IX secretion system membrane protein n=1 Tax=Allomuricauda sp. SCSIO 65647 TaxID=2908843 RepID=UPI001F27CB59|nr:type IX secretion system membrane protein PorP/SprF [Muricauda sp. SCSIO 65647]UJH69082.1 type IX secretion system membrane protein PorP/SprF [Muricauda sp. SCSIO 65647]